MADTKISALTASTTPLAGTEVLPIVQSGTTKQVSVANLTAGRAVSMLSATAGNVQVSGNTVTTTDTNGNLTINPNGSGYTVISAPTNGTYVHYFDQASRSFYVKQANVTGYDNDTLIHESDSGVGQFQWKNSGGILATLSDAGNLTLPAGNLVIGTSGKGIDFSATPGTGTSELLADYEEGNWTPTLRFGGGSTDMTYTTQQGRYTKVGRTVTIRFEITLSNKGSSTGEADITGLPFAAANLNSMSVYLYANFDATYRAGIAYLNASAINEIAANGTSFFTNTQFTNTSRFWGTCTYQV